MIGNSLVQKYPVCKFLASLRILLRRLLASGVDIKTLINQSAALMVMTGSARSKCSMIKSAPVFQVTRNVISLSLSVCLLSCTEGDMSDLQKFIAEVKARPKTAIEPLPEIKVVEPFLFNPETLRDPFVAATQSLQDTESANRAASGIRPDPLHQKELLEQFPLDALKMVGTVTINSELWGLVLVGEVTENAKEKTLGTIYRVRVGNYMGSNYGKIIRITEDKIELMEIVPDKPGTWREQEQALPLVLAQ